MNKKEGKNVDALGDRMKRYENITRYHLIPRTYTLCRIDGRAFHSYLKHAQKPFDSGVMEDMDKTALYLCENIQNATLGYLQSDEITILLCDFEDVNTEQFFGGNIQKMSSVIASMAAAKFNQLRIERQFQEKNQWYDTRLATFDCRCWNVPSAVEVMNVFRWRQKDCIKNSTSMAALTKYSHKELHGKNTSDKHEMLFQKGINWATDFTDAEKNGRIIFKEDVVLTGDEDPKVELRAWDDKGNVTERVPIQVYRTQWTIEGAWVFTQDEGKLLGMIPDYE